MSLYIMITVSVFLQLAWQEQVNSLYYIHMITFIGIPILYNDWQNNDIYFFYDAVNLFSPEITILTDHIEYNWPIDLTDAAVFEAQRDAGITKYLAKKITRCRDIFETTYEDFIVTMPFEVWEKVFAKLNKLTIGERKSTLRVWLYLYYWAMRFQGSYSRPRNLMLAELKINNNTLARAIAWLEQEMLIIRTPYCRIEGHESARRYYIPEELWNYQCLKETRDTQKLLVKH